jgi:hypothetical protein
MSTPLGSNNPNSMALVVVLPAPFPPSSTVIDPLWTVKEILSAAYKLPKSLHKLVTTIAF